MKTSKINPRLNDPKASEEKLELSFRQKQEQRLLGYKGFWQDSMERRALEVEKCGFSDLAQKIRLNIKERKTQFSKDSQAVESPLNQKHQGAPFDLNSILKLWESSKQQLSVSDQLRFGQMLGDLEKVDTPAQQRKMALSFRKDLLSRRLQTWTIRAEDDPRKTAQSTVNQPFDGEDIVKLDSARGPYHGATILGDSLQALAAADPVWLYDWYKLYQDLEDIE